MEVVAVVRVRVLLRGRRKQRMPIAAGEESPVDRLLRVCSSRMPIWQFVAPSPAGSAEETQSCMSGFALAVDGIPAATTVLVRVEKRQRRRKTGIQVAHSGELFHD
jgi:hypothetical protein